MNKTVIRVFLLIVYGLLSVEVTLLSIRSDGLGSMMPRTITFSWGSLFWERGPVGFLLPFVFYLLCLFTLTTICARSARRTASLSPLAFHTLGVIVALMNVKPGEPVTTGFLTVSVLLAGAYLWFDRSLARGKRTVHSGDEAVF